ncbi:MAG: PTS transporter subunit EIIB [Actinomycetaceae bacterium]|nr:PTS transporter subunit EIIB [Actinomycetaceae bacterium]
MTKARKLVDALGGARNIIELEPCIMRIRATVRDPKRVDEDAIRETEPLAVVCSGQFVQIIVGPEADDLVEAMDKTVAETAAQCESSHPGD